MSDYEEYEVDSDGEVDFDAEYGGGFEDENGVDYDGLDPVEEDEIGVAEYERPVEPFYNDELLEDEPEEEYEFEEEVIEYSEDVLVCCEPDEDEEFFAYDGMDPIEEDEIEANTAEEKEVFYNAEIFGDDEEGE